MTDSSLHHCASCIVCALILITGCATSEDAPTQGDLKQIAGISPPRLGVGGKGLDATLSTYAYPFPVKTYTTKVQSQKVSMAYMDVSPPQRVPKGIVVLLHGKSVGSDAWEETMRALVEEGYRVIASDQVGFGKSSKPTGFQFSLAQLARLTQELLQERSIERVLVVGHAMGGMLGIRLALMYPELVERLVLINPLGLEDYQRYMASPSIDDWVKRTRLRDAEGLKAYARQTYFDGKWEPRYERLIAIQAGWHAGPDRELMAYLSAQTYEMMFTQPVAHELDRLQMPTLLVIGARDRAAVGRSIAEPEVAEQMRDMVTLGRAAARVIPNSELVELDRLGHLPHYEDFPRFFAPLRDFLSAAPPSPSLMDDGSQ